MRCFATRSSGRTLASILSAALFLSLLAIFPFTTSNPAAAQFRGSMMHMPFHAQGRPGFAPRMPARAGIRPVERMPRARHPKLAVRSDERKPRHPSCGTARERYGRCGPGEGGHDGHRIIGSRGHLGIGVVTPERPRGGGIGGGGTAGGGGGNGGSAVPSGERRFVGNEVITQFSAGASPQAIAQMARRFNLTQLQSQNFTLIGGTLYRWRIAGRRSVPSLVNALGNQSLVAAVQPNYLFTLAEDTTQAAAGAAAAPSDPAQYVLSKLEVQKAQQIATGKNIALALIDSAIDTQHPDLAGSVAKSFDALGGRSDPQLHGTEMAGAIAAHGKLLGIAPGVQVLAARAFDNTPGKARGTSFDIYKSLQWATDNGARIVNMSFAGPADPMLHRMLAAAYKKDIVLVAAAGNEGPKAAPAYPAADPDVIAVTATDSDDHPFKLANRGKYVAVAAPGVDVLALAPNASYQLTTGTSVAAAHVSGVAALILQRVPSFKPADIRAILIATAKKLTPSGPRDDAGAGLVDAYQALTSPEIKALASEDGHAQAER